MNTNVIVIKTPAQTKAQAKEIANEFGLSLSGLINMLLKQVIRDKGIKLHIDEKPTQYLLEALKQSDEDIKAGKVTSFKSTKDMLDYLDDEIVDEKRRKATH